MSQKLSEYTSSTSHAFREIHDEIEAVKVVISYAGFRGLIVLPQLPLAKNSQAYAYMQRPLCRPNASLHWCDPCAEIAPEKTLRRIGPGPFHHLTERVGVRLCAIGSCALGGFSSLSFLGVPVNQGPFQHDACTQELTGG